MKKTSAEANRLYSSATLRSGAAPSSRTLWYELKQLPLCMDDFQNHSSQTLHHLAEVRPNPVCARAARTGMLRRHEQTRQCRGAPDHAVRNFRLMLIDSRGYSVHRHVEKHLPNRLANHMTRIVCIACAILPVVGASAACS